MPLTVTYRDADYDIDPFIDRTASWPDGLHEKFRYVPHLMPKVRRTTSADDISRYDRHFVLARRNNGKWFTWRYYLRMLRDDLRHFDTVIIMSKTMLPHFVTPTNSEISTYMTASESDNVRKRTPPKRAKVKYYPREDVIGGDAESVSSLDSNLSLTPQTNLLKRMCTEIRTLARKTCKTVEKMSTKSKYCISCGDYLGSVKVHKKCSQSFGDGTTYGKHLTPGIINVTNIVKTRSMTFVSPMRTPSSSGEFRTISQCSKTPCTPPTVCRVKTVDQQNK